MQYMSQPPEPTLTPPVTLRDACQVLREIIAVYDSSLVDAAERSTDAHFANLLEKAVDPAVEMCERMAELRKGSTDWDKDIFLINCLWAPVRLRSNRRLTLRVTAAHIRVISFHCSKGGTAGRGRAKAC